jgi:hypothetical protein
MNCALALVLSAVVLQAASPFEGKWKMNNQKSKYTKGDAPKEETIVIADQGDQMQVTIAGKDADGTPLAISYVVPVAGGAGQMQPGGSYNGVSAKTVNDTSRDISYTKDGKELAVEHMVIATDGNTMTVRVKGVDADGKPVDGVLIFDKQ